MERIPRRARCSAVEVPVNPAPTIATSGPAEKEELAARGSSKPRGHGGAPHWIRVSLIGGIPAPRSSLRLENGVRKAAFEEAQMKVGNDGPSPCGKGPSPNYFRITSKADLRASVFR